MSKFNDKLKNNPIYILIASIIIPIIVIISFIWNLNDRIDKRVDEKIANSKFINHLVEEITPFINTPYMIFDENSSISVDKGGSYYIENIIVEKDTFKWFKEIGEVPNKITIIAKQALQTAPLLSCLDSGDNYTITVKRGQKFNWEYTLELNGDMIIPRPVNKFRIDIIPSR